MMLGEKQRKFAKMATGLQQLILDNGYEFTFGDAFRDPRATFPYSNKNSLHGIRLAIDLNIFKDGLYLAKTEDLEIFGKWWENQGGAWGGRFKDGNHFSLEHEGMK